MVAFINCVFFLTQFILKTVFYAFKFSDSFRFLIEVLMKLFLLLLIKPLQLLLLIILCLQHNIESLCLLLKLITHHLFINLPEIFLVCIKLLQVFLYLLFKTIDRFFIFSILITNLSTIKIDLPLQFLPPFCFLDEILVQFVELLSTLFQSFLKDLFCNSFFLY